MADYDSIASTGRSIVRLLNSAFTEENPYPPKNKTTRATLIRTEDFRILADGTVEETAAVQSPAITVFCYRVDVNRTMRAPWSGVAHYDQRPRLPLDLHFLLTPWAENAEYELTILGRAMQCLEATPILTGPTLDPGGSWGPGDSIQVTLAELTTEEVMRTFDSLPVDFKLSVPYVARVVRVDEPRARPRPETSQVRVGMRPMADAGKVDPPQPSATEPLEVDE
ncbi:MAG TPA: DUF4255 domain-containing protein [Enhygromyxa sp.]|nr:DUF4255 domain-containing protein [Enhygromyxa sp.]